MKNYDLYKLVPYLNNIGIPININQLGNQAKLTLHGSINHVCRTLNVFIVKTKSGIEVHIPRHGILDSKTTALFTLNTINDESAFLFSILSNASLLKVCSDRHYWRKEVSFNDMCKMFEIFYVPSEKLFYRRVAKIQNEVNKTIYINMANKLYYLYSDDFQ